ncbi:MAG: sugar transferase, partial [Acidobacteria bacterium]|nr:sugar transferase [Acidobacteriota bacterium]
LSVRPGITALASLRYRSEEALLQASNDPGRLYLEKIMPDKLTLNLQYIESLSFIGDLTLIVLTLKSLVIRSTSGTNYGCLPV